MGESVSLRANDFRTLLHLIGECREMGADPVAWRTHFVKGAMRLVRARVGMCGESWLTSEGFSKPQVALGWNGNQAKIWEDYLRQHVGKDDLFWQRVQDEGALLRTVRRVDYVADRQWYQLEYVQQSWRPADVDRIILSGRDCISNEPKYDGLILLRAWGERPFGERERQLVELLHDETAHLIGRQLATADEPSATQLSPRRQQVLDCLLEGDSEKQVAARLGLTRQTVNHYIKAVYRHFCVNSRAELMAAFLRRITNRTKKESSRSHRQCH